MKPSSTHALIVDDQTGFRWRVRAVLQDDGYNVAGDAPDEILAAKHLESPPCGTSAAHRSARPPTSHSARSSNE